MKAFAIFPAAALAALTCAAGGGGDVAASGGQAGCQLPRPDAAFEFARADAVAAGAARPAEFAKAAALYSELAADGASRASTLLNLGTCRLLAGDVYGAARAYDAAERRTGETDETLQCQRAVWARLQDDSAATDEPFVRAALRPHYSLPLKTRILASAWAWAAMWILFAAGHAVRRVRGGRWPAFAVRTFAWLCAAVFAAAAASATISMAEEAKFASSLEEEAQ